MLYNAICFWMFFDVSYSNKNDLIWFEIRKYIGSYVAYKMQLTHLTLTCIIRLTKTNQKAMGPLLNAAQNK